MTMQERTIHHHMSRQYVFALGYALQYISSLVKIKTLVLSHLEKKDYPGSKSIYPELCSEKRGKRASPR